MCIYDIIDELININEIKCKTSNQIFTETFHDNSMRFSAITLFYYAQYYSIKSRPLSLTFKSRLPTARGTVNGKEVIAMRDTGCTGCVIRSSLVSKDQLLGKASDVTLINETTQRYPLALIDIDCPFFSGQTEALEYVEM